MISKHTPKPERPIDLLVIGADSLIGGAFLQRMSRAGVNAWGTSRRGQPSRSNLVHLDLLDQDKSSANVIAELSPKVAVVCASITSVERCRQNPGATTPINVDGTIALCRLLKKSGSHIVFLSTNQVFDGLIPHTPSATTTAPLTEYGRQKAEVERFLSTQSHNFTIVRLSKVLDAAPALLERWCIDMRAGKSITAYNDCWVSPVPLTFVLNALAGIVERRPPGLIQISATTEVTYVDIAFRIASRLSLSGALVQPVSMQQAGMSLYPPDRHATLDTARLESVLKLSPPPLWQTIDEAIDSVCFITESSAIRATGG